MDTIVAIATPPGEGGIAIVRIAGPQAARVGKALFRTVKLKPVETLTGHKAHHGVIVDPKSGEALDEVILIFFAAGKSFTGDETVEINCHGGPLIARRILDAALSLGARPAGPGEFTKRAFLAGRIDLSQAEAVADLIAASSDRELLNARKQLDGELSGIVKSQADILSDTLAEIESRIDFPDEEDVGALPADRLKDSLASAKQKLLELSNTYREGRVLREGYRVVIVGRANVGKSSLLNRLLGADRAIVTPEPGTTRDIIEERVVLRGIPFILTDTAGLRVSMLGEPEMIGISRTYAEVESRRADPGGGLLLVLLDSSAPLCDDDLKVLESARNVPHIVALNKSDLSAVLDTSNLPPPFNGGKAILISALKGKGMVELIDALVERRTAGGSSAPSDGYLLTNARHKAAIDRSLDGIERALEALTAQPPEIAALEIRLAREALDEIAGSSLPDDILDIIFSRFCIGK